MTQKMRRVAFFGRGVLAKSAVVTRQRRVNCYLEVRKDDDKTSIACYGTPGLKFAFNASSPLNLPSRGLIGNATALYNVAGSTLKVLGSNGTVSATQLIGSGSGLVGLALNPTQLMIVDGSLGYCYTPSSNTIVAVGASFPNGAKTVTYSNGFFVCELPGTNEFFVSNLNDGTTWNGLSYATAVQAIDGILAVDQLAGILIPFSSGHCEFWQNVGSTPEPFQYIQNSAQMYGLAAVYARAHSGTDLYFLAQTGGGSFQNTGGAVQVARIRGYSVNVVSTPDIDNILQTAARTSTVSDATMYSYQQDSHTFVQLNLPTANRSLLYDTSEDLWSEVQTGITSGYAARHQGNLCASAYGQTYISDYQNGNLYTYDPTVYTDNGSTILREVVGRAMVENGNTFRCSQILFDMETGVGLSSPSAQGYSPNVMISVARDGRNFCPPRLVPLGMQGQDYTRVVSRRWGKARTEMTVRLQMTDPVKFVVAYGAVRISQTSRKG